MTVSEAIIRYFLDHSISLSALVEALDKRKLTVDDVAIIKGAMQDANILLQIEALLSVLPDTVSVLDAQLTGLSDFRQANRNVLRTADFRWDVTDDVTGMLMLSRGAMKTAFNTGNESLGIMPGTILTSNLYADYQLLSNGFLIQTL